MSAIRLSGYTALVWWRPDKIHQAKACEPWLAAHRGVTRLFCPYVPAPTRLTCLGEVQTATRNITENETPIWVDLCGRSCATDCPCSTRVGSTRASTHRRGEKSAAEEQTRERRECTQLMGNDLGIVRHVTPARFSARVGVAPRRVFAQPQGPYGQPRRRPCLAAGSVRCPIFEPGDGDELDVEVQLDLGKGATAPSWARRHATDHTEIPPPPDILFGRPSGSPQQHAVAAHGCDAGIAVK